MCDIDGTHDDRFRVEGDNEGRLIDGHGLCMEILGNFPFDSII